MTLLDGTRLQAGDACRVRAERGEGGGKGWRVCKIVSVLSGGVDKAIVTAPSPFGTVIVGRYDVRRYVRGERPSTAK